MRSQAAEVLYEAADPYSRKVIIDRGVTHNVVLGSPVVNEAGVLGQVTRVYLQSAEVTLLTDRDAAIPVLNSRTQVRSAAFGGGSGGVGLLEMRFMAGNADVQVGDLLTTSGVDGVYPPGLKVAPVAKVDRKIDSGFARIVLAAGGAVGRRAPRPRPRADRRAAAAAAAGGGVGSAPRRASRPARRGPQMIMPRRNDPLLLPVNPLFVWTTLAVAFLLNIVPLGRVPAMPDFLALVLVFWNVHQSRRIGVGVAFFFGLLMDVHSGAVLGQHALAYTLLSFFAVTIHRRLLWFTVPSQAVQILPLFLAAQAVSLVVHLIAGGMFPGWELILAPVFQALLWPVATWLLLAPQRRAPDPDENRPLEPRSAMTELQQHRARDRALSPPPGWRRRCSS